MIGREEKAKASGPCPWYQAAVERLNRGSTPSPSVPACIIYAAKWKRTGSSGKESLPSDQTGGDGRRGTGAGLLREAGGVEAGTLTNYEGF